MSCSLMTATCSVSKPDSMPTTASIASLRGVACTVRQELTLVRLSSLWSFNMLPMRSREPSLHSAITTFLRWACRAPTWATTASNTLIEVSARSGVKLRPARAPASTTPALPSGTANGVSRASAASSRCLVHSASVR